MKRVLVLFTAALLVMTCSVPVFAAQTVSRFDRPVRIYYSGAKAETPAQESAESQPSGIPMGQVMPEVSFTTIDGETFDTAQILKEKKALLINFFRVTCPFCVDEFPLFNELAAEYGDQVAFLALDSNTYDTEEEIRKLRDENSIAIPVAPEKTWVLSDIIPYDGYPCTIVLDKTGALVFYQDYAIKSVDGLKKVFDTILAEDYESGFEEVHAYDIDFAQELAEAEAENAQAEDAAGEGAGEAAEKGYRIVVKDQNGDPVPNVMINFCSEAQQTCRMDATNATGELFFEVPEDTYHIAILAVPEGYSYDIDFEMYTKPYYGDPIDISIKKD